MPKWLAHALAPHSRGGSVVDTSLYGGILEPATVAASRRPRLPSASPISSQDVSGGFSLGSALPYVGPVMSALGIGAQMYTNWKNRELQRDINAQQERLVHEMNAYNSPVSQMARYKAAGLNPLAFMDNVTPGNQSDYASLGTPQYESPDFGAVGDAFQNTLSYQLQAQQTRQLENLRIAQGLFYNAQTGNVNQNTEQAAAIFGLKQAQLYETVRNLAQDVENKRVNIEEAYSRIGLNRAQVSEVYAKIDNLYASSALYRQQVDYYAKMTGLLSWQVKYMDAYNSLYMKDDIDANHLLNLSNGLGAYYAAMGCAAETYVAENSKDYNVSLAKWSAEKMRSDAGQSYDWWQQGMALQWTNTVTDGIGHILGGAAAIAGPGKLFSAPYKPVTGLRRY